MSPTIPTISIASRPTAEAMHMAQRRLSQRFALICPKKLYQRPGWLTHAGDSRIAAGLIQVGAGDSRHAISGQIARGLFG